MSKTMDMLQSEHRTIARLLDLLERQVDLFEKAGHPDYELLAEIIDYFRSYPDLYHHPKEDLVLEKLKTRNPQKASEIGDLEEEHAEVTERLNTFTRAITNVLMEVEMPRETFVKIARDFIEGERRHMTGEERVFFPAARKYLTAEDWEDLDRHVSKFSDPLSKDRTVGRFEILMNELPN